MQQNRVTPEHSTKFSDHTGLYSIHVTLNRCPDHLIMIDQQTDKLVIDTPKFTVKYHLEIPFPENLNIDYNSVKNQFNGTLLILTYKAAQKVAQSEQKREQQAKPAQKSGSEQKIIENQNQTQNQKEKIENKQNKNENQNQNQKSIQQNEKQQKINLDQKENQQELKNTKETAENIKNEKKITSKIDQLLNSDIRIQQPKIVLKERKTNNKQATKKTRLISNILNEKRVTNENEMMLKIAQKAVKQAQDRESAKIERVEKKEQLVMQQLEAKQKRKEFKDKKKMEIIKRIKDREGK